MRYGILGDIHANLSALITVLDRMDAEGVEQFLSVGDVVGYGAAPEECIGLLRERETVVVKGNHDAACSGELDLRCFNPQARAAAEWTRDRLSRADRRWLKGLPMVASLEHCTVVHGTLDRPEHYDYVQRPEDADGSLEQMTQPVCFAGHTHVPVTLLRTVDDPRRTAYTREPDLDLNEVCHALVNVGSVGQPRDEDDRAAYVVFDTAESQVRLRRVPYDIAREARRIRAAGLPPILADRLFLGV